MIMETSQLAEPIERLKIEDSDIFLEELGEGKGKITVSNTYGHNYSMFWGAMGGTLKDFICRINSEYFADKLLGHSSIYVMDVKNTFTSIRKFISSELYLPWYKHQEFQKQMRETLNTFQRDCEEYDSQEYFVSNFFNYFVDRLDFYLIEDKWERESLERDFKGISEPWGFIQSKPGPNYIWLTNLHSKLKQKLS